MSCGVKSCALNDDHFLWKCEYCNKKYHAACIGVKRDREFFITAFVMPVCADCQDRLHQELDVRKLLHGQEQLLEAVQAQTDANHRMAKNLQKFELISELFDSIEHLINDARETLGRINVKNDNMRGMIEKHMDTCESMLQSTVSKIQNSNDHLSKELATTKQMTVRIDAELSRKVAESVGHTAEERLSEILDEFSSVLSKINQEVDSPSSHKSLVHDTSKSLAEELSEVKQLAEQPSDHRIPGWRNLGNKWQWKADWTNYDAKQRARRLLQKHADKAKRIRKRKQQQCQQQHQQKQQQRQQQHLLRRQQLIIRPDVSTDRNSHPAVLQR